MADIIQKRRDTAANFTAANTLLAQGEEAYELDTGFEKRGDGVTLWNSLPYLSSGGGSGTVESVTGEGVNNTDPANPVISFPDATEVDFTPAGNISATDVAGAIAELDSEKQPIDPDLTAIAALTPTDNDFIQRKSGAWTNRTPAQAKADLNLTKVDVGLGNVDNTSDANKPVSTAQSTAITTAQSNAQTYADNQINNALAGIKWKTSVRAATTANITLSGTQTIDGVALSAGERVLVKDQTTQTQNGIYVVAAGAWSRATDADTASELQSAVVSVEEGTVNFDTTWRQNTDNITVGSSNIVWSTFGATVADATETIKGIAEIATTAEVSTGTDDTRIVSTLKLAQQKGASGGIVGMSGFSIAFKNLANTFTSLIQNAATAARTYTFQDKSYTVADVADIPVEADQTETDAGTSGLKWISPRRLFGKFKAKTTTSAAFSVDSTNDLKTIMANPTGAINCTVNAAATDVIVPLLNYGTANINFVAGSGVTLSGISTLVPLRGASIRYTSATTAVIVGGGTISWGNILLKPNTVVGFGIIDAIRLLFSSFTAASNTSTTETTMYTTTVTGGTLGTDGAVLPFVVAVRTAANANSKTIKIKFGGITIFDTTAMAITAATDFCLRGEIIRGASDKFKAVITMISSNSSVAPTCKINQLTTLDLTADQAFAITGQGGASADVTFEFTSGTKSGA